MTTRTISTTDLCLAATLKVKGFRLLNIEKQGKRGTFFFQDVTDELIKEFHMGNILVEPSIFHQAVRSLAEAAKRLP